MPEIPVVPSFWRFPADPACVRRARHVVTEALPGPLRRQLGDELGLVASELVTNAIRYGSCTGEEEQVEVVLWPADGHYWLAVSDAGSGGLKPVVRQAGADAERGRGLLLVEAVAAAWGVVPRPVRGRSVVAGLAVGPDVKRA
ncbi:ATP-binding protein [Actinacidiphila yeochonensis]|uniref:ATP-binding protein n=1 Tax=Actinacidiphila yeochonensis TaxID=89050 RepID=UPI000562EB2B|nr:ATP-binding protein [Actinacidiphila yeochonensis]